MTTIQNVLRAEILMHCYCSPEPIPRLHEAPAVGEELRSLINIGAIELDVPTNGISLYKTTPLGRAWVKAILNTPLPRMCFVDQHGKEIE